MMVIRRTAGAIRRRVVGATAAASMLATAIVVAVAPAPAHADGTLIPPGEFSCAAYPDIVWQRIHSGVNIWSAYRHQLLSSTPTFDVADGRIVANNLPNDAQVVFTSQQTRTFTLQVTAGVTAKVGDFLTVQLGVQVTQVRSTTIGVQVTTVVPANTTVLGEYGLSAYDVVYDVQKLWKDNTKCSAQSPQRGSAHAPTVTEGWRFRTV